MTSIQTNAQNSGGSPAEPQLHFTPPKSHRFLFLDALRGVAALFVVAFHFPTMMTSSAAANGPLAVDFFFCLSGFVIAFSYENRLKETLSFKDFAVARLIRLYPIYALGSLIGLLIGIAIQHAVYHSGKTWSSWIPLVTLAVLLLPTRWSSLAQSENYPLNGPAWSLFFEVFANFAYALFMKLRIARTAVLLCIVAGSLGFLVNAVVSGKGLDVGPTQADFTLGFARVAFSFFFGILICRLYSSRKKNLEAKSTKWFFPVIITFALIAILNSPFFWMRTDISRLIAIAICFPAMVYYGAVTRLPRSLTRLSTALGELSYPLYLLHMPFVSLMSARHLLQFTATHPTLVHTLVPCIITIAAFLSWQVGEHIDLPIRRALTRHYNSYKQSKLSSISDQASAPKIAPALHDDA